MSDLAYYVAAAWLIGCALLAAVICAVGNRKPSPTLPGSLAEKPTDPSWLSILAATEEPPTITAHPAAGRIVDLIAANEAKRVDAEWARFAEEWSR